MFFRTFKYKVIRNFGQKQNIFWTLFFPIILATFFYLAFGNLAKLDTLEGVKVAIVDKDNSGKQLIQTIKDINVFKSEVISQSKADSKIKDGKITAIIQIKNSEVELIIKENGMSETIVKSILDKISQTTSTVKNIYQINPNGDKTNLNKLLEEQQSFVDNDIDESKNNDPYSILFFALIGMTILSASMTSLWSVAEIQGNQTNIGARQNIAPTNKLTLFGASITADMVTQCFGTTMLLFYIRYVLGYNIGKISGWLLLICYVALFASISLGTFVAVACKGKLMVKNVILNAIMLVSSGVAGLFTPQIKVILENKLPIIAYINPATLISDGLISLYYFDSMRMYFTRLAILAGAGIVLFLASSFILSKQKYESIPSFEQSFKEAQ